MFRLKALYPIVIILGFVALAPKVKAETFDREVSGFVSGPGTSIYLGTGVTLPFVYSDDADESVVGLQVMSSF